MDRCRSCQAPLGAPFLSLGAQPVSNAYLRPEHLALVEPRYPLDVIRCEHCQLVQIDEHELAASIFGEEYPYFASFSESWLAHCRAYTEMAVGRFGLGPHSLVAEAASNDGYLLQYFHARGIPVLGIEPARSVATASVAKGIPTEVTFFTADYATAMPRRADLLIGNNVLAHVPNINDFVEAFARGLAPQGVATLEFPHLLRTIEGNQFDTIYHEHYSYLSLHAVVPLFARHGLAVFDVEELQTHGGSLRVFAQPAATGRHAIEGSVERVLGDERAAGLLGGDTYARFGERAAAVRTGLLALLRDARRAGKRIVGYGAPAKGNTLLNYCDITAELIEYTVDRNPHKQGRFLPGSRIPVFAPERIAADKPDLVVVLPWNIQAEIVEQLAGIRAWGGQFVIPIPVPRIIA